MNCVIVAAGPKEAVGIALSLGQIRIGKEFIRGSVIDSKISDLEKSAAKAGFVDTVYSGFETQIVFSEELSEVLSEDEEGLPVISYAPKENRTYFDIASHALSVPKRTIIAASKPGDMSFLKLYTALGLKGRDIRRARLKEENGRYELLSVMTRGQTLKLLLKETALMNIRLLCEKEPSLDPDLYAGLLDDALKEKDMQSVAEAVKKAEAKARDDYLKLHNELLLVCPACGKRLKREPESLNCCCGFGIPLVIYEKALDPDDIQAVLMSGQSRLLDGFMINGRQMRGVVFADKEDDYEIRVAVLQ